MRLVSLNTGLPKDVLYNTKVVRTGIFKSPVNGKVKVSFNGLEGDGQADRIHHGGEHKAVYAYLKHHYNFWQNQLPKKELTYGIFGENLTIDADISEDKIHIGDCFKIGTTELMAVQPRIPCFKLAIRFDNPDIIKLFTKSLYSGVYFKVIKEGEIEQSQEFKLIKKSQDNISILDIFKLIIEDTHNLEMMKKSIAINELAPNIKELFQSRIQHLES